MLSMSTKALNEYLRDYGSEFNYHKKHYNIVLQDDGSYLHNDGEYFWYNEAGQIHREDGPAITCESDNLDDRDHSWYLNDEDLTLEEFLRETPVSDEIKMMLRLRYE
jgi:hypothetical protein